MTHSKVISDEWSENEIRLQHLALPELTGGVNPGDQRVLFHIVKFFGIKRILEIGTHLGCSTVSLALALEKNDNPTKQITTVDIRDVNDETLRPWLSYGSRSSPLEMIRKLGCESHVKFCEGHSLEFLKTSNERFDLIFLDGDHSAQTVFKEIPLAAQLLNPEGLILLHDYFPNGKSLWEESRPGLGPYLALKKMMDCGQKIVPIPLGELPWSTKFNSHKTSLAILSRTE